MFRETSGNKGFILPGMDTQLWAYISLPFPTRLHPAAPSMNFTGCHQPTLDPETHYIVKEMRKGDDTNRFSQLQLLLAAG